MCDTCCLFCRSVCLLIEALILLYLCWCYFQFFDPGLFIKPFFFSFAPVISTMRHLTWFFSCYLFMFVSFSLLSIYILFVFVYFLGTMAFPCIWFGSFMRHSAISRFELPITYAIGRSLQIWMTVFQMLHQKSSMCKLITHSICMFLVSSQLSNVIGYFYAYAEVMLPASYVVRRWPLLRNLFVGICFMYIASVHG